MTTIFPTSEQPIGTSDPGAAGRIPFFNARKTVISQYANSPIILAIIDKLSVSLDGQYLVDWFYELIWNIDTAVGYGLDLWGRILGISRVLHVAEGSYIGLYPQTEAQPLSHGILYRGASSTSNFALTDDAYRTLLLAKAAANITDGSIPALNQILLSIFPQYGNSYVRDNEDMTITYVIGETPTPVDLAIIAQSGVLPRPAGVSVTVEHP